MSRTRIVRQLLDVVGGLAILVALGWAVWQIIELSKVENAAAAAYGSIFITAIGLIVGGVALWGVSELLRTLEDGRDAGTPARSDGDSGRVVESRGGDAGLPMHTVDELAVLLREVRDISLLDGEQRKLRLELQGRAALDMLRREVPTLLREHNWIEARHRVQDARARFPMIRDFGEMEQQIEQMRSQVENADMDAAERQINDLIQLGAWDRVAEVVTELLKRHPDSQSVIELSQKIRTQRNSAEIEQRGRLMAQAQEAKNKRDWKTALTLANMIVQRYPKSPEAQGLRMQLPTLRENAEIQTRQALEQQYREAVGGHRYADALRIASEVIDQYPNSPQAEALRGQLGKLRDAAAALT